MPWDPTVDFQFMWENTQDFMPLDCILAGILYVGPRSLWRSFKPTICHLIGVQEL